MVGDSNNNNNNNNNNITTTLWHYIMTLWNYANTFTILMILLFSIHCNTFTFTILMILFLFIHLFIYISLHFLNILMISTILAILHFIFWRYLFVFVFFCYLPIIFGHKSKIFWLLRPPSAAGMSYWGFFWFSLMIRLNFNSFNKHFEEKLGERRTFDF